MRHSRFTTHDSQHEPHKRRVQHDINYPTLTTHHSPLTTVAAQTQTTAQHQLSGTPDSRLTIHNTSRTNAEYSTTSAIRHSRFTTDDSRHEPHKRRVQHDINYPTLTTHHSPLTTSGRTNADYRTTSAIRHSRFTTDDSQHEPHKRRVQHDISYPTLAPHPSP